MGFTELCIRRPVFATVLSLVLLLAGLMSYSRLTIREYPAIDEPQVSVQTSYSGASAGIIESQVTQVLEGSLAGIEGIDTIESTSRAESSRITVRFRSTVNIDAATSDVRDRVSRVRRQLPDEITEPVISKVEADAQPIIFLVMQSDTMSALELTDYVDRFVVNRFKNLDGVADVTVNGERRYAMRVWIDPARLAGYGLTVQDVENAIRAQNAEIPAGRVEGAEREFTILSRTSLGTAEEVARIKLKNAGGLQGTRIGAQPKLQRRLLSETRCIQGRLCSCTVYGKELAAAAMNKEDGCRGMCLRAVPRREVPHECRDNGDAGELHRRLAGQPHRHRTAAVVPYKEDLVAIDRVVRHDRGHGLTDEACVDICGLGATQRCVAAVCPIDAARFGVQQQRTTALGQLLQVGERVKRVR